LPCVAHGNWQGQLIVKAGVCACECVCEVRIRVPSNTNME
jgi:hypothetical protein